MTVGLVVVCSVLLVGAGIGLWRRRVDGRLRTVAAAGGPPLRSSVVDEHGHGPSLPSSVADGRGHDSPRADGADRLDPDLLGSLGVLPARATLLQFSSAFCAPCRAVRRVSAEVAALVPGVRHVEVDAESHLAAVRALGVWRTPTLFVLDAGGRVVKRATGVPSKPQLIAAIGEALPD